MTRTERVHLTPSASVSLPRPMPWRAALVVLLVGLATGLGSSVARAEAGPVKLAEDATGLALVLALAEANPKGEVCMWIPSGRGSRVSVGRTVLEGRLNCQSKVVGPALAGRTRASRLWLVDATSGLTAALDRYGEPGAFYGRGARRSIGFSGNAAALWERLREPGTVIVMPGNAPQPPELPYDRSCDGVVDFTTEELAQALQASRDRMDHCWPRHAPRSAFTFDIVSDRAGLALPKVLASLRHEPKVAACLASALSQVQFDPERARCHQVFTQWPVTSKP